MSQNSNEKDNEHSVQSIGEKLDKLGVQLEKIQIADYVQLLNTPKKLIFLNLIGGTARGVGIAIGFTIVGGTLIYILQKLGALNLPIIGDYIAEIVKIVQGQLGTGVR